MVTMGAVRGESTLAVLARQLGRAGRMIRTGHSAIRSLLRLLLTLAALGAFTVAAFKLSSIVGYVMIGVSLLTVEWLVKDAPKRERQ